jgi:hypothetical protein
MVLYYAINVLATFFPVAQVHIILMHFLIAALLSGLRFNVAVITILVALVGKAHSAERIFMSRATF